MSIGYVLNCYNIPCCDYVAATPCPVNPDAPTVYIRRDTFPDGSSNPTYFAVGGIRDRVNWDNPSAPFHTFAYSVNPGGTGVKPPHDALTFTYDQLGIRGTCTPPPEHKPGGGVGGNPPPTPPGSPHIPWGVQATLCSGESAYGNNLYVVLFLLADGETGLAIEDGTTKYFRYSGRCWSYNETDTPINLTGKEYVSTFGNYDDCADCRAVLAAYPCPNQSVNIPIVYVRPDLYLDSAGNPLHPGTYIFSHAGGCYAFDPSDGLVNPPAGESKDILTVVGVPPTSDAAAPYKICDECTKGVMCVVCSNTKADIAAAATKLWVPHIHKPAVKVYFRYNKVCYSCDPADTEVYRPDDAFSFIPTDQYIDCGACKCGDRALVHGIKATLCGGQTAGASREAWIPTIDPPTTDQYFEFRRQCWKIRSNQTPAYIPPGAEIIPGYFGQYKDCAECLTDLTDPTNPPPNNPPPFPPPVDPPDPPPFPPPVLPPVLPPPLPPGWPPNPPPGNPPPRPPWDALPPPPNNPPNPPPGTGDSLFLKDCITGALTGGAVKKVLGIAGKVIANGDNCEAVTAIETNGAPPPPPQVFQSCQQCELAKKWIQLVDCSTGALTGVWVSKLEYIQGGGQDRPVYIYGTDPFTLCATATGPETTTRPTPVISGPRLKSCDAPECSTPCGNCTGGDGKTPKMWDVSFLTVNIEMPCKSCGDGYRKKLSGTLGTYPLTQHPTNPCVWYYNGPGPTLRVSESSDCSTGDSEFSTLYIALVAGAVNWRLIVDCTAGVPTDPTDEGEVKGHWFSDDETTIGFDCGLAKTFNNSIQATHEDPADDFTCGDFGVGGTAVATPRAA